jgi:hypothetical protein
MDPDEEPELRTDKFIRQICRQNEMFFPKHYLLLEVERLEVSIKHFFEAGTISKDDYEFLIITLKMMKKFLTICVRSPQKTDYKFNKKSWDYKNIPPDRQRFSRHNIPNQPSLFDSRNPLPIKGEIVVSGLNENLQALRPKEVESEGPKFPYKIPAGTHWNNVIIKFLDDEKVEILVKKQLHLTDYKEMGMVGRGKNPEPSEQWLFLKVLAQYNGEITIKDTEAKDKYKKQKQVLTDTLRSYFAIDYDPFYPYQSCLEKGGNSYKIKLLLIPPPKKDNSKQNFIKDDADTLGITEFLNETAPQILDS